MLGHYGLGMKLYAFDRILAVPQSHYQSVRRSGGHFESIRHTVLVDDQGVISCRFESVRQPTKDRCRIVADFARLAVHQLSRADYQAAERFTNRLVPETHAQNWKLAGKRLNRSDCDARSFRHARARRYHDSFGLELADLIDRDGIIAKDLWVGAKLSQVLNEVVRERIVVVYDKNHVIAK